MTKTHGVIIVVDILAMDCLCADVFDSTGAILPGGEALNFAAIASEFPAVSVSIMGAIGGDEYGAAILKSIENKRIDRNFIHVFPDEKTATHRIYLTSEGDRYFKPDSWNGGVRDTYRLSGSDRSRIMRADAVFITYDSPNFDDVLELRKRGKFALAVDFNVFRDLESLTPILDYIDYFMISGNESLLPEFCELSKRFGGVFNVTLAEKGSVTYRVGREYRTGAVPVEKVVDTTGCGDSYHAAFLCSLLAGSDISSAMSAASRTASRTLAHLGGFE